jgi:uncharacterized protein
MRSFAWAVPSVNRVDTLSTFHHTALLNIGQGSVARGFGVARGIAVARGAGVAKMASTVRVSANASEPVVAMPLPAEGAAPDFAPPWWLRNGHVQSLLGSLPVRRLLLRPRVRGLLEAATDEVLDCGDGVRLHGHLSRHAEGARDLAVLIHGWEGNAESLYILSAGAYLFDQGFDVFRLHLRDHGPSHHLNRELFHANRLDEVVGAVRCVQERFARGRMFLAGFSLGGNFALRVAVRSPTEGVIPTRVAAVCPVLCPRRSLGALEAGLPVYRSYFMRKWRRSLRTKHTVYPDLLDMDRILEARTITDLTDHFVRHHTEFPSADAYLAGYAITGDVLATLEVPAHLFAAEDDPVIPAADLDTLARPAALELVRVPTGGHCAFLDRLDGPSWIDRQLAALFSR